jgi:hypothetical protein
LARIIAHSYSSFSRSMVSKCADAASTEANNESSWSVSSTRNMVERAIESEGSVRLDCMKA